MTGQWGAASDAARLSAHAHTGAEGLSVHLAHFVLVAVAFVAFMGYVWRENRRGAGGAELHSGTPPSGPRWLVSSLLVLAGLGHIPVTAEHLREAPYMGVLFIGFTLASLAVAGLLAVSSSRGAYWLAAGLCAAAVGAYVATRLVAFPDLADDVGAWLEPLGVLCVLSESLVVVSAGWEIRRLSHLSGPAPALQSR